MAKADGAAPAGQETKRGGGPAAAEQTAPPSPPSTLQISKAEYRKISGRQTKQLHDQADRYGLPLRGTVIDLAQVVRAFHDLLATRAAGDQPEADQPGLFDESPAMRRYRMARAEREELRLKTDLEQALDRDQVHEVWLRMAGHLRSLGEQYARQFEPEVLAMLDEVLADCWREMQRLGLASTASTSKKPPRPRASKNGSKSKRKTKAAAKGKRKGERKKGKAKAAPQPAAT